MATVVNTLQNRGFELIETHISWVLLSADTVFKIKKPVNLGFLDFSTLEKRRQACEAEVKLNARLAPNVYRGVVAVTQTEGGPLELGGSGAVVEFAVEMTRLPDARRGDVLLDCNALGLDAVDELARTLAHFHASMPTSSAISAFGAPQAILRNVVENFDQTRSSVLEHVTEAEAAELRSKQDSFVETHRELLERRMFAGRVRDGHGDLRLEHVYFLDDGPTIIDCIEFSERFRYQDVCADVAFLSMDLSRLGRVDLAERLLASYARFSGDYELYRLVDFYEAYRAHVRAKVASLVLSDSEASSGARLHASAEARRHYLLALSAGRESLLRPAVVAVGGIIGSGKSTIAEVVSRLMAAPVVDADRTRKSMLGMDATQAAPEAPWSGAYAPELTERVYEEVLQRATHVLSSGRPVLLDASFRSAQFRRAARELAKAHGVPFFFLETQAPRELCLDRLRTREREGSVSDGRAALYDDFVARWEPVTEIGAPEHVIVDTRLDLEENAALLKEVVPTWPGGLTC